MRVSGRSPLVSVGLAALAPLLLYLALRFWPGLDPRWSDAHFHFQIVSGVALAAAAVGFGVGLAGVRLRNLQVVLHSLAFVSLGVMMAAHGLATPDMLMSYSPVTPIAAQLGVLLAALWLWLSVRPSDHPLVRPLARRERLLPLLWTGLVVAFAALLLAWPALPRALPADSSPWYFLIGLVTLAPLLATAQHYADSYRYARAPLQLSTALGALWLAVVQVIVSTGDVWQASWWLYHVLLFGVVIAGVWGLVAQYRRGPGLGAAVQGLWTSDPDALLQSGVSRPVRELLATLEAHDPYTAGHSYRVAREAVRLGRAVGCTPEELRALAQGGLLHDLGKLRVDRRILGKPGPLTPEERREIEKHPVLGHEMCCTLGSLPLELGIIRHHHERWDGGGYPDGLAGEKIPRLARILSIADVYDALTSGRAYRSPWNAERARAHISSAAGTQFDPRLVERWLALPGEDAAPAAPDAPIVPWAARA